MDMMTFMMEFMTCAALAVLIFGCALSSVTKSDEMEERAASRFAPIVVGVVCVIVLAFHIGILFDMVNMGPFVNACGG